MKIKNEITLNKEEKENFKKVISVLDKIISVLEKANADDVEVEDESFDILENLVGASSVIDYLYF